MTEDKGPLQVQVWADGNGFVLWGDGRLDILEDGRPSVILSPKKVQDLMAAYRQHFPGGP